jgi:hypothetical protein
MFNQPPKEEETLAVQVVTCEQVSETMPKEG